MRSAVPHYPKVAYKSMNNFETDMIYTDEPVKTGWMDIIAFIAILAFVGTLLWVAASGAL